MKHTPGPWTAGWTVNTDGEPILTVDDAEEWTVCVVDDQNGQGEANARMIAEAPAMLKALRALADELDSAYGYWRREATGGDIDPFGGSVEQVLADAQTIIERIES